MPADLSILITVIGIAFLLVFLAILLITLISLLRWFKGPRIHYAPLRVEEYMCPKCGSKDLEVVGLRTIRCRKCGTIFTLRTVAHEGRWIIWPFFWWFPIIIPILLFRK